MLHLGSRGWPRLGRGALNKCDASDPGVPGVAFSADVSGLSPSAHGLHIHALGACAPDLAAAGDHFNPRSGGHGFLHEDGAHAGDRLACGVIQPR